MEQGRGSNLSHDDKHMYSYKMEGFRRHEETAKAL
jgi:hypothetical protein